MIRRSRLLVVAAAVGAAVAITATGSAATTGDPDTREGQHLFHESLNSYNEVPAASTTGSAQVRLFINDRTQEISWRLSYADLSAPITQAHVHFGALSTNGGISFFFCTNAANGPAGTQLCPAAPATISGTIKPADIIGPAGQGIAAGEFAEIVKAIRAGFAYANVHSQTFPAGEVRAQLGHRH